MRYAILFFLLCRIYPLTISAQSSPIVCGNDLFSQMVRKHNPELQDAFDKTFNDARQATARRGQDPLTVNVIVHIVWKEEAENLDESIILDQIRILNEDYNKLNADIGNLRPFFQDEAGTAGIQFQLAEVIRVQTSVDFEVDLLGTNLLPEVKSTLLGGSDARDPEQYLNIWVCRIQPIVIFGVEVGQILGFAFPPNNLPNWPENSGAPQPDQDGVVIDFRVFGSNNPNPIQNPGTGGTLVVKGRTAVHETGHYFGLRHIWGDGGILGPNDCAQSDGINDTPYANAQSAFDCDKTRNTCLQVESHYGEDAPDLIENFMDYASEDCMNMFTNEQVTLMRNVLEGPRSGLLMPFSGVRELTTLHTNRIYPNPATDEFNIEFETSEQTELLIRIQRADGTIVHNRDKETFLPGCHTVSFQALTLSPGIYFATMSNKNGSETQKIIVQSGE